MPFPQFYCVEWLDGHEVTARRGLAWLIPRPEGTAIDAKVEFQKLDDAARRNLRDRFDWWLRTFGITKKEYCHGWDEDDYENVWVFKYREHRIFGFLCHPDVNDGRFVLCVLCSYTIKEGWEADKTLKDLMKDFARNETLLKAARNVHEEKYCSYNKTEV
ncbi:MAG: hypothetical protein WBD16_04280 [Pyrinomonadaceae bacterium]